MNIIKKKFIFIFSTAVFVLAIAVLGRNIKNTALAFISKRQNLVENLLTMFFCMVLLGLEKQHYPTLLQTNLVRNLR